MNAGLPIFQISSDRNDCCVTLSLMGELDGASAESLDSHVDIFRQQSISHLLIDCAALDFIDSGGLHALIRAHHAFEGRVALFALQKSAKQLFEITGLEQVFLDFDSIEGAREHLHIGHQEVNPRVPA
ncbi:MAG TPA: STAS domain-containing protein [Acidimicrobiia bacterium]|nr:STAS domain-containing protein [Acidimicrobiia bacterium]